MASSRARGRAEYFAEYASTPVAALLCGLLALAGCGGSAPTEASIYHDPALRPGAIEPASDDERELLARLSALQGDESVRVGSRTFVLEPTYAAASGRRCRAVSSEEARRLACESPDGWVFVPDVRQDDLPEPGGAAQ